MDCWRGRRIETRGVLEDGFQALPTKNGFDEMMVVHLYWVFFRHD